MKPTFIDKVNQIVLDNLDNEKFGVSELAREIGLSRSQTFRKIKSYTGKSANQLIRETRLQEAAKLISNSDLHASEISYKVGFSSPSYFNKCFRKYYGVTPGEFTDQFKSSPTALGFNRPHNHLGIKRIQFLLYAIGFSLLVLGIWSIIDNIFLRPLHQC